ESYYLLIIAVKNYYGNVTIAFFVCCNMQCYPFNNSFFMHPIKSIFNNVYWVLLFT
ncbi:hypothetical protein GIB67_004903, partial [Kingdonia uniflora]